MVVMVMSVRVRGLFRVGAAFRIEWRFDARNLRAQFHHQLFQHMIPADTNAISEDLRRHVAIAEMPCNTRKVMRVARRDLRDRLAGRDHAHDAAVFELQPIAIVQHRGFGKIEQKNRILRAAHGDAAAVPAIMWQFDAVGFPCVVPMAGRQDFGGADHDSTRYCFAAYTSKKEIALRHRQHRRRLAGQQLAVGADLVGLGIDLDHSASRRCGSCLGDAAARVLTGTSFFDAEFLREARVERRLLTKVTDDWS
jgi:hypothetical protein